MPRQKKCGNKTKRRAISRKALLELCRDPSMTQKQIGQIVGMSNSEISKLAVKNGIRRKDERCEVYIDFIATHHDITCGVCTVTLDGEEHWKASKLVR